MALCEKILLAGFSGAGKSTLLREIERCAPHDWTRFDDLDQLILKSREKKYRDLATLIDEIGWEKFRLIERQELEGWLKEEGKGVLALGGGALTPLILELYGRSQKIKFCHIDASFETCWERLRKAQEIRPLIQKGKSELEKIYLERSKVFDHIPWKICNDSGSVKEVAQIFWKE